MFLGIVYLIFGFVFLILGANLLVKGASNIAKRFNISEILIGLTIVALGTSMPELIVTITSANKGAGELIIGNAIGSNLCNLLLVLGVIAIIKPIKIDKQTKNIHIPVSLFVTMLILLMGLSSTIDKIDGFILLILFFIYFSYPIIQQVKGVGEAISHPHKESNVFLQALYILIGIVLLKYGGDLVVNNSISIAKVLNVGENIIGLTIIAFGTSLPELVTSIVAVIKGDENLAVGNIVGSCISNLLLILGTGAVLTSLNISTQVIINLSILIVATLAIWGFNFFGKKNYITRIKGIQLLVIFTLYIINVFVL